MIFFIRKQSRKASLLIILFTVLLVLSGFTQEEKEGRSCEKALERCLDDGEKLVSNSALFSNYLAYCMVGYVFCVKYLEK